MHYNKLDAHDKSAFRTRYPSLLVKLNTSIKTNELRLAQLIVQKEKDFTSLEKNIEELSAHHHQDHPATLKVSKATLEEFNDSLTRSYQPKARQNLTTQTTAEASGGSYTSKRQQDVLTQAFAASRSRKLG